MKRAKTLLQHARDPTTQRETRSDSINGELTHWTEEGYLIDRPIVTKVGVFEYTQPDGSVRRELRLADEVFNASSLASYKGKPVIVTHDAGEVTKDNVADEIIGTILSEGYRDGDNVRAEITIHDTDELKRFRFRELSLGYSVDLDFSSGEWNGQTYDAIQRNIRINHLALVESARAGDNARLNIDGKQTKKEGTQMAKKKPRHDSDALTPEQMAEAVALFKAKEDEMGSAISSVDEGETQDPLNPLNSAEPETQDEEEFKPDAEEVVGEVKAHKDRRDEEGAPTDLESAVAQIEEMAADIEKLIQVTQEQSAVTDEETEPAADGDTDEPIN